MVNRILEGYGSSVRSIDFDSWGGIDGFLRVTGGGAAGRASMLKSVNPWLSKAVYMTANAISGLPFDIVANGGEVVDRSTDWINAVGFMPSPRKTISLVAGALCGGSAYLMPMRTSKLIDMQYIAPHTIKPVIGVNGIEHFVRTLGGGQSVKLKPDELFYFWLPDCDVEIGSPLTSPMSSALVATELLSSMSSTLKIYGDRGFVPAYIGSVKGMPSKDEKEKAENYLTRFLRGAYQNVVKLINSDAMTLLRVGAGMEELKGAYSEIQSQAIEDICAAFGIPAALFMSDKAYATEIKSLTRTWYETSIFVSIYQTIEEVFNEQILSGGMRLQFKPESLSAFQEDENERATAVKTYTDAISVNPKIAAFAMSVLGVDLDAAQEAELEKIIAARNKPAPEPEEKVEDAKSSQLSLAPDEVKDLVLWYSKAKAWHLRGKGTAVDWENKHLRESIAAPIRARLADAKNELDIVKAFAIGEVEDDDAIKMLAASIDRMVAAAK